MNKQDIKVFSNLRVLIFAAIMSAFVIVLDKYVSIKIGNTIRIGFGNLPVIISGCLFGPFVGMAVGAVGDIVGCIIYGFSINPIITAGMMSVGFVSGVLTRKHTPLYIVLATFSAHIVGSMIIKSIGLYIYYGLTRETLQWRIVSDLIIATIESFIIIAVCANKPIIRMVRGLKKR